MEKLDKIGMVGADDFKNKARIQEMLALLKEQIEDPESSLLMTMKMVDGLMLLAYMAGFAHGAEIISQHAIMFPLPEPPRL